MRRTGCWSARRIAASTARVPSASPPTARTVPGPPTPPRNRPGTRQYTLFDGNWLNWRTNPATVSRTRLEIVQEVVNGVLDNINGVNVGLMQFNFDQGGAVSHAVDNVATARGSMMAAVNALTPFDAHAAQRNLV